MIPIMTSFQHLSPFWEGRRAQIGAAGDLARKAALARMAWLNDELSGRQFVAGSRYTIADITAQCAFVFSERIQAPPLM